MEGLVEHDVIRRHKQSSGPHGYRFLIPELDTFVGSLLSNAVPLAPGTKEVLSLSDAAQRVKTSVHEIANLIRNRRLKWVGYRTDLRGVRSVVVDAEDVADALKQSRPQTLNSFAAASRLNVSPAAVRFLVKENLLVGVWRKDPISHRMRLFFQASDVEQFDRTYVSLHNLGRLSGRSTAKLRIELAKKSVLPVTEAPGVTSIYRRGDLDD
jgi:predicted HTH domain antitoxin